MSRLTMTDFNRDMYFDMNGNPMSMDEWTKVFKDIESRRIGMWEGIGTKVSTIWLGLNHQWGDGPPVIFETMVDLGDGWDWCWRYTTKEAAKRGHEIVVEAVIHGLDLESLEVPES